MSIDSNDKALPMASAPMRFTDDGTVDWENMWDTFCVLAREGGPPHRPTLLRAQIASDPSSDTYQAAAEEICRAIPLVSGLHAVPAEPGWIAVTCPSIEAAQWLSESIVQEGVEARYEGSMLYIPCGEGFSLEGEMKNVVTAVAKTTHYYADHLPSEVKVALRVRRWLTRLRGGFPTA